MIDAWCFMNDSVMLCDFVMHSLSFLRVASVCMMTRLTGEIYESDKSRQSRTFADLQA